MVAPVEIRFATERKTPGLSQRAIASRAAIFPVSGDSIRFSGATTAHGSNVELPQTLEPLRSSRYVALQTNLAIPESAMLVYLVARSLEHLYFLRHSGKYSKTGVMWTEFPVKKQSYSNLNLPTSIAIGNTSAAYIVPGKTDMRKQAQALIDQLERKGYLRTEFDSDGVYEGQSRIFFTEKAQPLIRTMTKDWAGKPIKQMKAALTDKVDQIRSDAERMAIEEVMGTTDPVALGMNPINPWGVVKAVIQVTRQTSREFKDEVNRHYIPQPQPKPTLLQRWFGKAPNTQTPSPYRAKVYIEESMLPTKGRLYAALRATTTEQQQNVDRILSKLVTAGIINEFKVSEFSGNREKTRYHQLNDPDKLVTYMLPRGATYYTLANDTSIRTDLSWINYELQDLIDKTLGEDHPLGYRRQFLTYDSRGN